MGEFFKFLGKFWENWGLQGKKYAQKRAAKFSFASRWGGAGEREIKPCYGGILSSLGSKPRVWCCNITGSPPAGGVADSSPRSLYFIH